MSLSDAARRVLAAIEDGLPLVARPYAAAASAAGLGEQELTDGLEALCEQEVVKRLGLVVRHHELGYRANAMVVWDVDDADVGAVGRLMATYPCVTLCYRRPRRLPLWPYNLFCMVHGRDRREVRALVRDIAADLGLEDSSHEVLFSRRRFKQRGARYGLAARAAEG